MKVLTCCILVFCCIYGTVCGAPFLSECKSVPAGALQIHQINNPGEIGDIYLIIAPDGTTTLLDTGVIATGETVLIPALEKRNIRRIDQLIISHFHSDHAGGAITLLADPEFEIGRIICTFPPENEVVREEASSLKLYRTMKMFAARRHIPWIQVSAGDKLAFGAEVSANVIGGATVDYGIKDHNGQSLVFLLRYKDFTMLFTGDCSFAQEKVIFQKDVNLKCDVLKMAHHGGAGSNSARFLDFASPQIAVATQPDWLARDSRGIRVEKMLRERNIPYYRSWEQGDMVIFSDGKSFGVCRD